MSVVSKAKASLGTDPIMQTIGGTAGLAAAFILPTYVVKNTSTMGQRILKLAVSLAGAAAAGMVFKKFLPKAGNAALIGGLSGFGAQALTMAVPSLNPVRTLPIARMAGPISTANPVSAGANRQDETVSMIQP